MGEKPYKVPLAFDVNIHNVKMGGGHPPVIQSMANTDTRNIEDSINQLQRMVEHGAQLVRFTTQGLKEVKSLHQISLSITEKNITVPLVADVHFSAKVAYEAAKVCQKVRINPGNFTEKNYAKVDFSNEDYLEGLAENKTALLSLIKICTKHNTALRIGVNHGSLSKRIMSRYGDTPIGMVESALEFLRICNEVRFQNVIVSIKSSNTRVMVYSVRLLVKKMIDEGLYYPLHLGVTESGDGLEGRIKSVVGIAPLLLEGMGDTIRVSLTEAPEKELPVADKIRGFFVKPTSLPYHPLENLPWNPFSYEKLLVHETLGIGGENPPVVISAKGTYTDPVPDIQGFFENNQWKLIVNSKEEVLVPWSGLEVPESKFLIANTDSSIQKLTSIPGLRVIILFAEKASITDIKYWLISYRSQGGMNPIILHKKYNETDKESYCIQASGDFGLLLIDGLLNGVWLENDTMTAAFNNWLSFYLLQASRNRTTSTEYIACPSCGRTLFDIQSVLKEVRTKTTHLKGLKIAVMGCIVNGPGEMADADYGYVGAGKGLVSIYKGKRILLKNIPSEKAVQQLMNVIRENGDWIDP